MEDLLWCEQEKDVTSSKFTLWLHISKHSNSCDAMRNTYYIQAIHNNKTSTSWESSFAQMSRLGESGVGHMRQVLQRKA